MNWSAAGAFVLLKKESSESEAGLIINTHYCVKSIGDAVPINLNRGDSVIVSDDAKLLPFTEQHPQSLYIVHYGDIMARTALEEIPYVEVGHNKYA